MENKVEKPSGTKDILEYMRHNAFITDEIARDKFGVHRLSARIFDLRKKYTIKTVIVEGKNRYGKTCKYARYFLMEG